MSEQHTDPAEKPKERPTFQRTLGRRMLAWSARVGRLTAYFGFVALVLLVVAARMAYAHAKKMALDTGSELVRLTGTGDLTGVYRLRINGEEVRTTNATSDLEPTVLLDRFQAECEDHADGMATEFAALRGAIASSATPRNEGFPGVGTFRENGDGGGVVVCFAIGKESKPTEVYGRIAEFAKSGDLAKIGHVRYVMVKRGKSSGSQVVALWTEGSLDVKKMFPDEGDAPGSDVPNVMRPPSSRRILTAYAEGAPYGIRAYESSVKADAILAQYDDVMTKTGWQSFPGAVEAVPYARSYSKDGVDVTVTTREENGKTTISIVDMGH